MTTTTDDTALSLNFNLIETKVMGKFKTAESNMAKKISDLADDPSMKDIVAMQMESQKWTMFGELTTKLTQSLSEFCKKCIQQSS